MVEKSALMKEIDSLPPRYYGEVVDFVGYIKQKKANERASLEKAAEMAAEEYRNNKELTAFCALDGDPLDYTERQRTLYGNMTVNELYNKIAESENTGN